MNINVFSWLLSFFKLRESGKQNLGVKGKCPKVTYLIFLTGFHWRISLLSRASRLGTIFNAGLRDSGLSCLSLLSLARSENGYRPSATSVAQKLPFFVFTSVEGKGTPLPFGVPPPIIWLHFLFPLPMSGDPRSLKCKHLCDPQSFLTVTFWLLDNFSSTGREYHSHLLVSVSHHVTPPRLREEREMNRNTIEKKGNSIHCSLSFPFTFFFSFYFSFIPFLLHALMNSFLFLFSSFLIFTIGEDNFSSLSFSLSLFFFFNLVFLSFFFSLGFWPYHISNLEEVSPSFFLSFFVTFDDLISLVIKLWGRNFLFFSLFPLSVTCWRTAFSSISYFNIGDENSSFSLVSLSLFLSLNNYERIFCYYIFVGR